ncbi:9237_t:CDS:1 [Acaulospora morrowiae]|uniref:9237_t:CDS:1 n=1 Tax=Acaulospora morrowiae TaxID=94023 RepID=A0A9N8Z471_9GLOM|nr:9237_t:CDS:1 [Acaulospora morrowiae]
MEDIILILINKKAYTLRGYFNILYINKLPRFSSDPHTLSSQTTLDLIVNNHLGKSMLSESIDQPFLNQKMALNNNFNLQNSWVDRRPYLILLLQFIISVHNRISKFMSGNKII